MKHSACQKCQDAQQRATVVVGLLTDWQGRAADLEQAARGALAALSQPATYPADVEAAKSILQSAIGPGAACPTPRTVPSAAQLRSAASTAGPAGIASPGT